MNHYNDIGIKDNLSEKSIVLSNNLPINRQDDNLVLLYKKTERIIAAVHLITDVLSKEESARQNLRTMSFALALRAPNVFSTSGRNDFHSALEALSVGLAGSAAAGLVSPELIPVFNDELLNLKQVSLQIGTDRHVLLPDNFFAVAAAARTNLPQKELSIKDKDDDKPEDLVSVTPKQQGREVRVSSPQDKRDISNVRKKDRKVAILTYLQTHDDVSVKALTTVIKDCSEKTLQRELLALVAQGVLKKKGERRWSTYSIR